MSQDTKRESIKESGRKYVRYLGNRRHLLKNPEPLHHSGLEIWQTRRDGPGYGVRYKNTALQFMRAIGDKEQHG